MADPLAALGVRDPAAFKAVLLVQLLNGVGYGMVFPVAAFYGEAAGLSPAGITLLVAAHPLARLAAAPLWGRVADRYGRRPVLLAGIALQALGHLVFGLSGAAWGLGVGRVLTGLGSGDAVAATAMVADLTPPSGRAGAMGLSRAASGLGVLGGPVLGGLLGLWDLRWPGLAAAAACLVNFVQVVRTCPETRPARPEAGEVGGGELPPARALLIAGVAAGAIGMAEAVSPLAAEHVLVPTLVLPAGWSPAEVAVLLTVGIILAWGLTTAVFDGVVSARIVERLGERTALVLGLAGWALAFALTPPVYQLGVVAGGIAVIATAAPVSVASVALMTWASRRAGPGSQGRAGGAVQGAAAVGEFAGPAMAGVLYERFYGLPYHVSSVALVGAALLAMTLPMVGAELAERQAK